MGRIIGTILGAILAIWLAVTAAGGIFATFKMFLIIGLIAMAVFIAVWLVARRPRARLARRHPAGPQTSASRPCNRIIQGEHRAEDAHGYQGRAQR
jgi:predicted lipid-binding transport protein (Tim44 family)